MPTISRFLGLTIHMHFNDHGPPHIHVKERSGGETWFNLDGEIFKVKGKKLGKTKQDAVATWIYMRQKDLRENWRRARADEDLFFIEPLS